MPTLQAPATLSDLIQRVREYFPDITRQRGGSSYMVRSFVSYINNQMVCFVGTADLARLIAAIEDSLDYHQRQLSSATADLEDKQEYDCGCDDCREEIEDLERQIREFTLLIRLDHLFLDLAVPTRKRLRGA